MCKIRCKEEIDVKSCEFLNKLSKYLDNMKNQGVFIIRFFNAAGSIVFQLPKDKKTWTTKALENQRQYAKDRILSNDFKASFNKLNIEDLTNFIFTNLDSNKLRACMSEFDVPQNIAEDKDKFAKALSYQLKKIVSSLDDEVSNDITSIYQALLNNEEISSHLTKTPKYDGDTATVHSINKYINANCYEKCSYEWEIQNYGNVEWIDRKLVLMNADELYPEILQTVIPIPKAKHNDIVKIKVDINAGAFEGDFECKWEMQDAESNNCFPNYKRDFNIYICVTFDETKDYD